MRWDLIDRFEFLKKSERSVATKFFSGAEDFFREHDPESPRLPEPLLIEMVAQAGGILYGFGLDFRKEVVLVKVESAEFFGIVQPPCELRVEAQISEEREEGAWIEGFVKMNNQMIARVRLLLVAMDGLDGKSKVVFNDRLLSHYDVYRVAGLSGAPTQ